MDALREAAAQPTRRELPRRARAVPTREQRCRVRSAERQGRGDLRAAAEEDENGGRRQPYGKVMIIERPVKSKQEKMTLSSQNIADAPECLICSFLKLAFRFAY